jgi:hypothetical protein
MQLKSKADSKLMKFIGFFYPKFLTSYWTTIGDTIYYPTTVVIATEADKKARSVTIQHEMVHVEQYKKYGIPLFFYAFASVFFVL